jgi:CRISPR-associated exonuclease Cas4
MLAKKMGVDFYASGVSIIESGGKTNIPFFIKVLNAFRIFYVVVHDVDPLSEGETDTDRIRLFHVNDTIRETVDGSLGTIMQLDPEFDVVLGVAGHQIDKLGKPFAVFSKIKTIEPESIDERLKDIVSRCI